MRRFKNIARNISDTKEIFLCLGSNVKGMGLRINENDTMIMAQEKAQ